MDSVLIAFGLFWVELGVAIAVIRLVLPNQLAGLQSLQTKLGETTGTMAHVAFYTVAPLALGSALLVRGVTA